MPKIIENLKGRLLAETKHQIINSSYESVTIRSIAKGCGVGVGTVYNYFPSKEDLIAASMLEDWNCCLNVIQATAEHSDVPQPVLQSIFDQLTDFAHRYRAIFCAEAAIAGFAGSFRQYHDLLRFQLTEPVRKYCCDEFSAQFIAESLLTWSLAGKSFDEIHKILKKLF